MNGFLIEGVNVNPGALVQDLVQYPQGLFIPLLFSESILFTPEALTAAMRVLLNGSGTHC